mgnify:CR=1 FL=1|tara:strand:- start:1194 stop:1508 length:315 start_codon:yes stop_codon:yes gene_type:complete
MQDFFTYYNIIIGGLVGIIIIFIYILRNLLIKVEKYEDEVEKQITYIENISKIINKSQTHIKNLDEKGVFESDDETGEFFETLKGIQTNIDQFRVSQDYGKSEE